MRPFIVIPWEQDFLGGLLRIALEENYGDLSRAAFLFPHSRPKSYLTRLLRCDERVTRPLLLPRMYTVAEIFAAVAGQASGRQAAQAGLLDRVGLLLDCVRAEDADAAMFQALPGLRPQRAAQAVLPHADDARHFFPWGVRLAAVFEECFTQASVPKDFQYLEGQVTPFAARLLERLSVIYARYVEGLEKREWTTPGRDAAKAAEYLAGNGRLPEALFDGALYIAGFHSLTKTEEILFRALRQETDARIVLHADRGIVDGKGHWSCAPLLEWSKRLHAPMKLYDTEESRGIMPLAGFGAEPQMYSNTPSQPTIRYYEGFDLHSQLAVLYREIREAFPDTEQTREEAPPPRGYSAEAAVVLPDTGLLMPVLHHLPPVDINVSMGYPLSRSPLYRLIDTILRLREGRRDTGWYWRDLIELIRHPYIKMLTTVSPPAGSSSPYPAGREDEDTAVGIRRELGRLEERIRASDRSRQDPFALLERLRAEAFDPPTRTAPGIREFRKAAEPLFGEGSRGIMPHAGLGAEPQMYLATAPERNREECFALVGRILEICLRAFEQPATPKQVAGALEDLCDLLSDHGKPLWERFLIDAECLFRIRQSIIPELARSAAADEAFSPETLTALTRRLFEQERVPFDAYPLVGLQVMGMLETRLLNFRRLYILDTTEDQLPGTPAGDPLLPDALRQELDLPDPHTREQVAAYHFFRLLAGAEEAVILWQEGAETSGALSGKKKKSRFVEELLWREEQRRGKVFASQGKDGPLEVLATDISPLPAQESGVAVSEAVRVLIEERLRRPLSASLLDAFLRCPLQFFYERLTRLSPAEEVTEGEDPSMVGTLLHNTLRDCFEPFARTGAFLPAGSDLTEQQLRTAHDELMARLYQREEYASLCRSLGADSLAVLQTAGAERLLRFLRNRPAGRIVALETDMNAVFDVGDLSVQLTGKADRIDLRPASPALADPARPGGFIPGRPGGEDDFRAYGGLPPMLHILDYKTGTPVGPAGSFWKDTPLWQAVARCAAPTAVAKTPAGAIHATGTCMPDETDNLLAEIARLGKSVQLPLYLLLFSLGREQQRLPEWSTALPPLSGLSAAWVTLGLSGEETALFPDRFTTYERQLAEMEQIPALIRFIINKLRNTNYFFPHPGPHCRWCSSAKTCRLGIAS